MLEEIFLDKATGTFFDCLNYTAQKMKLPIIDFFSKCEQTRRKLRIWLHLLKESLMENFIFCFELQFAHRLALVLECQGRYISKFDH